jgi:two-component system, OmpR family, sensor kinase
VSLRARLFFGTAVVLIALAVAMAFVARSQQRFLVDQLDQRLLTARPIAGRRPLPPISPSSVTPPPEDGEQADDFLLSELYLGSITDGGTLRPLVAGALVDDTPTVTAQQAASAGGPFTVEGVAGTTTFRVLATEMAPGEFMILAIPLDEVEDAQNRLALTLALAWVVALVVLSLTTWWMIRLGLRPINQMTKTADALARGERGRRVEFEGPATETGRLGRAFNTMLDERDVAEQRLRMFVADASHELRTPLTSVRGYLDLALDGELSPASLTESLRRARSESRRMGDLVEDLFLLAQLDQGRTLRQERVDLGVVIEDAASDARAMEPARTIEVDRAVGGDTVVEGDQHRLRQVVASLVQNALVHTPPTATIKLVVRPMRDSVIVDVADDGPGLPAGLQHNVFDRFTRGEQSRSRQTGGAGLGLAIARSIVEAHHGTISVDATPGSGCTFSIRLPRSPDADHQELLPR